MLATAGVLCFRFQRLVSVHRKRHRLPLHSELAAAEAGGGALKSPALSPGLSPVYGGARRRSHQQYGQLSGHTPVEQSPRAGLLAVAAAVGAVGPSHLAAPAAVALAPSTGLSSPVARHPRHQQQQQQHPSHPSHPFAPHGGNHGGGG